MLADQFSQIFRQEHRIVRDTLLDLIQAFVSRDKSRIQELIGQVAEHTGPHFRYEEESLYPELVPIFGAEYVERLFSDHDRAIGTAKQLAALGARESLSDQDVAQAVVWVRSILPHVSDCDGLSIMVERLDEDKVQAIFDSRERSNAAGLNLLVWAEQVRKRPLPAVI
ncbi:MAG: hemerythrin domain-containing protein [Terriglobia bacterium]